MPEPLMTYVEVTAYLRSIGAEHKRTRGTHEAWRLPNGHRITVPVAHGDAGRKAWEQRRARQRWVELQNALKRGPADGWGRGR